MRSISLAILLVCALAHADRDPLLGIADKIVLSGGLAVPPDVMPRFAFAVDAPYDGHDNSEDPATASNVVIAHAITGKATWIALDMTHQPICGNGDCRHVKPSGHGHLTMLFDAETALAWHVGKDHGANAEAKASAPKAIERKIEAGAVDVVKRFETTLADPKAFAKTVSQRNDVVLYGSALAERYVGGNQVRAQLAKWNLAFKVRDGLRAGLDGSKTVAWIAANVDAGKPGDKRTTPYRALLVYEKHDASWDVVQLQFSVVL